MVGAKRMASVTYFLASPTDSADGLAPGETRGDSGRERAAGAMRVVGGDARRREGLGLRTVEEEVGSRTVHVSALDDDRLSAERDDILGSVAHIVHVLNLAAYQGLSLWDVRCDDGREGDEDGLKGIDGVLAQQPRSTLRHHDGIDDERGHAVLGNLLRHRLDDPGAGQHTRLDGIRADVGDDGVDLRPNHRAGHVDDIGNGLRILRGDGRQDRSTIDAHGGEGLQIGLNTRSTTGVGSGNRHRFREVSHRCVTRLALGLSLSGVSMTEPIGYAKVARRSPCSERLDIM